MRKLTLYFVTAAMLLTLAACAPPAAATAGADPSPTANMQDDVVQARIQIGVSLAGSDGFHQQLAADFNAACASLGYDANVVPADSGAQQASDIQSFLGAGATVIIVDPVDVDALEAALAECESEGVPVINIIDSVNGVVSTLITPDYAGIGKRAGERAVALYGETGGACLELKTDYDSFVMQLISDGFLNALGGDEDVTLAAEEYCGGDEEAAYEAVKKHIGDVSFIFAYSDALANGAARAITESGRTVSLVVFGGGQTVMEALSSGAVDTALFLDTSEIANRAVTDADGFLKDAAYVPAQYQQLEVYAATAENVGACYTNSLYAKPPA